MKIQLKNARIYDPNSKHDGQTLHVLIENGQLVRISKKLDPEALTITSKNLCVSTGWVDLKADFCDPGHEHKETIQSGLDAASAGGYTQVFAQAMNQPVTDNKAQVAYLLSKAAQHSTSLHVIGALTQHGAGEELAELYDLYQHGVRLFSDDTHAVSAGILQRALLYTQNFGGCVSVFSREHSLASKAMVNEGEASTKTGLKADPHISELIALERNIRLAEYTNGRLHLSGISTAEGVELIRKAKKKGLSISADVHLMNLVFTEKDMLDFNTLHKVLPVLRTNQDQKALWKGVLDGTIDAIVSDHRPTDPEEKELEFDLASFGAPQLETVFAALNTQQPEALSFFLNALTTGPRRVAGLPIPRIEEGEAADLSIFDPSLDFQVVSETAQTRFSPFANSKLTGKVLGIINGHQACLQLPA
ncbi:MAG: hypothetical protein RLZZ301_708 [Bacteroidota bacterium]|jgi:dihydroorotase